MGFPERLKELRESRGLSQETLADTLGIPRSSLTHYEKPEQGEKERLPRRERLEKIADYFGVSVDYLLGRTDDPSLPDKKDKTIQGLAFIDGGVEELDEEEMDYLRESLELFRRMKERKAKEREKNK